MIGPAGYMAAPEQSEEKPPAVWAVDWETTYVGRVYWVIWRRQAGVYGGRAYMMTPSGRDRKRFYDQPSAEKAAAKLNEAADQPAAPTSQGEAK